MSGQFVISLDFELLWGMRDRADRRTYGENILGARVAIPRIMELFAKSDISATWAIVGFLFCKNRDELMDVSPTVDQRPRYHNPKLSNYNYFTELGWNETESPHYFAASIIEQIANTPKQEIGTHTFSHFYTLERGATIEAFEADLAAARTIANLRGIKLQSIVFPRNQYSMEHLEVCQRAGLDTWRGNPSGWVHRTTPADGQTLLRRGLRLMDSYSNILGSQTYSLDTGACRNVPASRFLRPCGTGNLSAFHSAHIAIIKRGMTQAAKTARGYHLWWHPHNFGLNIEANLAGLAEIIKHFNVLQDTYGMQSLAMRDVA